jgi:cyanophycinase
MPRFPSSARCSVARLRIALLTAVSAIAFHGAASAVGTIMLAGGGPEGNIGHTGSWSYPLYKGLVDNGDIDHDGRVTVAILSTSKETEWLPHYFEWLGADAAFNVRVNNAKDANDPAIVDVVATADVIFIKGGDQGRYYDEWNGTLLEQRIRGVIDAGGAIGGTSAGAMSLAQYCLCGSMDLVSLDVLEDATTHRLDDKQGGSGIHADFLGVVPGVFVDTHYTTRARLGRLLGVHGKTVQDYGLPTLLSIGIEERTGLLIHGSVARVMGVGSVDFVQQSADSVLRRDPGRPLVYTDLRDDILTDGGDYDLAARAPDLAHLPRGSVAVHYPGDGPDNAGALAIKGDAAQAEAAFSAWPAVSPAPYALEPGTLQPQILRSLGLVDAQDAQTDANGVYLRGDDQAAILRALYDAPSYSAFLVPRSSQLTRRANSANAIHFDHRTLAKEAEAATIVIDCKLCTSASLSRTVANEDAGDGSLHSAGFVNMRVHVLAESEARGITYDSRTHAVTMPAD